MENHEIVEYFINQGASLSISDSWGLTPLHWTILVVRETMLNPNYAEAAIEAAIEVFKAILKGCNKYDIDRMTKKGIACLHLAADLGNLEIVQCLIERGANTNIRTISGITPLHLACKNNNDDVILLLLQSLDSDALTISYISCPWSPMHFASYFGSSDALKTLINEENDPDSLIERFHQRTSNGNTCLHLAVQQFRLEIVKILLYHGADVNLKNEVCPDLYMIFSNFINKDGISVVDMKRIINDEEISKCLLPDQCDEALPNHEEVLIFQREEFSDDEQLEGLFLDVLNELDYFG